MPSFKKLAIGWQYQISYKVAKKYKTKRANGFLTKEKAQLAATDMESKIIQDHDF
ncbi:Arm DNA-binding domain-containing protein [Listeria fleischmannii]|uniref:AP2-like integrase N-terminal domain-containing protein n=1 Tax=Listeria fleischmannii TaxID=1069827 RepID=A0A841YEX3_9LIST|nr:Arm DNA-binding domain-containing protein [Listeria fleischmannii]EIA19201.1 hypothetical protein KKC_13690 [Listeria fleischmannii subsp. coloradonensis]MBC1398678.1 hypothetical protein [Listeria fleischmannii]MBC1426978.1 hypothetical protein [Listeria fleischmannii]STY35978.1 Uncharacterised protein [Listeria fleischmannii subsp. coloradonensis]